MSYAYDIADAIVPHDAEIARGCPMIWVHMWLDVYRRALGRPHKMYGVVAMGGRDG